MTKKAKRRALAIFLGVSFVGPLVEVVVTGRIEPFSATGAAFGVLGMIAVYSWYYLDKIERHFRSGTFQNIAVVIFAAIGLPVYFFRSRGLRGGAIATAGAVAVLLVGQVLGFGGEEMGKKLRSNPVFERTAGHSATRLTATKVLVDSGPRQSSTGGRSDTRSRRPEIT